MVPLPLETKKKRYKTRANKARPRTIDRMICKLAVDVNQICGSKRHFMITNAAVGI